MKTSKQILPAGQRGISLIVTLLIVVLLSLLGLYGAGVLVLDTRSAANDFRAREAGAAAESGTEQGLSFLKANRERILAGGLDTNGDGAAETAWTACTSTAAMCLPIRAADRTNWQYLTVTGYASQPVDAGEFASYVLTPAAGDESRLVYHVVAIGESEDGTSEATLRQGAYFYPLLLGNVATPLAAASNVPLSGNYSIITNSNGGGTGVPVSAWSDSDITPGGSFASCHIGDFESGACPSDDALSKNGVTGPDMIGNDPDFPADLFEFLFGVPEAEYQKIKDEAKVVADCSGLGPTSSGLIWVTGDCSAPGDIGSEENPVLLVVEGDVTLNAGSQLYGLLYLFDPLFDPANPPKLIANGNAHLHGAVFAHDGVVLQLNGGFVLEYDSEVLDNLKNSPSSRGLARIPGAWSDVQ
jgi:Tfp pilus assembly protein PilX